MRLCIVTNPPEGDGMHISVLDKNYKSVAELEKDMRNNPNNFLSEVQYTLHEDKSILTLHEEKTIRLEKK